MPKRIFPKHVQRHGNHMTYILSIAGERIQGGMYHTATIAAFEAEIVKRYARARYGTKAAAMRAAVPEADLQAYATERGYDLSYPAIFQFLPPWIRELFTDRGDEIGRNFAELEPRSLREVLVTEGRRERQQFKLDRIAAQTAASAKRAEIWLKAQQAAAEAWKNAKLEFELRRMCLGGAPVTRERALEGLGDEATWGAHAKALYAEFKKKPNAT